MVALSIDDVLEDIQRRWGANAIQSARQIVPPTGILSHDGTVDALVGGLCRGKVNAMSGVPTSGKTTLAYHWLAAAQHAGERIVYMDINGTFDPAYAAQCGLQIEELMLVRPESLTDALWLVRDIALNDAVSLLVIDAVVLNARLEKLVLGQMTLLALTNVAVTSAQVQMTCRCESWRKHSQAVVGCNMRLTLTRHPARPSGNSIMLDMTFAERDR